MFAPKFNITNQIANLLTQIERARGFLEAAALSEEWIREMSARAVLLEAHHTTHIEGTRLTLEQAERLWKGEEVVDADPQDARELLNYRKAFDLVAEYLNSGEPITEGLIREIHKRLVAGVRGEQAQPGKYRLIQNYVVNSATGETIYTPPPSQEVPHLMAELVEWLNSEREAHPVLVSGIAQFQLVHDHPFVDGNGRTARLLSTLCLYQGGYDFKQLFTISEYYDRDRRRYYEAIQSVRNSGMKMTRWLEYFVEGLCVQMREVRQRGEQVIKRDVLAKKCQLSSRQALALGYLIEHGQMQITDFEAICADVNRRTLQRDLSALIQKGIIKAEGATNRLVYHLKDPKLATNL
ncbi:MAG: Fic family protein [bacterium]